MPTPRPTTQAALNKCQLVLLLLFSAYCVPGTYRAAVRKTGRQGEDRSRECAVTERRQTGGEGETEARAGCEGMGRGHRGLENPPVVPKEGERSALSLMGTQRLVQPLMRAPVEPTFK